MFFLKFLSKSIPFLSFWGATIFFSQTFYQCFEKKKEIETELWRSKKRQIILKPQFFICLKFWIKICEKKRFFLPNLSKTGGGRERIIRRRREKIVANSARPKFGSMYSFISMKMSVHLFFYARMFIHFFPNFFRTYRRQYQWSEITGNAWLTSKTLCITSNTLPYYQKNKHFQKLNKNKWTDDMIDILFSWVCSC